MVLRYQVLKDGHIASVLAKEMCLAATETESVLGSCGGAAATFVFPPTWPGPIQSAADSSLCLAAVVLAGSLPVGGSANANAASKEVEVDRFVPTGWEATGLS